MKKILSLLLVVLTCLSLVACSEEEVENPIKQYSSLEEINKIAGVCLVSPEFSGKKNEKYYMIDNNTASYVFELDGYQYCMRGTKDTKNDMSGIFKNSVPLFDENSDMIAKEEAEGYKVYRTILGNKQYIFEVHDEGKIDDETFDNQFEQVYDQIIYESSISDVKAMIGDYQDSVSQRAMLKVSLIDVNVFQFDITWSSSATEYDEWIVIVPAKDVKLDYDKIDHYRVTCQENGTESRENLDDYLPGYFKTEDGKIYWTGCGDE